MCDKLNEKFATFILFFLNICNNMLGSRLAIVISFSRQLSRFVETLEIRVFSSHSLPKKKKKE